MGWVWGGVSSFQWGVGQRPTVLLLTFLPEGRHVRKGIQYAMSSVDCLSSSEEETVAIGWRLARVLRPGSLVMIHGDIGVGKTVLARGLIHGLGHGDPYVTSPTFTLVNVYTEGRLPVYHFDLYRIVSIEELFISGAGDYLDVGGVCLVEWPEILIERGLKDYLDVIITTKNNGPLTNREIVMRSHGPSSDQLLQLFS